MNAAMRRTGIDIVGDVPWGTHFCQFYEGVSDLIDILVPYFREGLYANEFCMWVTSQPLQVEQAATALRAAVPDLDERMVEGQIEILDYSQWYTRSGEFQASEVLQGWVDKLNAAQKRGYEGLRLTGNTFWLERADWDDFTRYEEMINDIIGRYPMLAFCTYSLQKCSAVEVLDVIANHQFALIKRSGKWESIESSHHKKMEQALRETKDYLENLIDHANAPIIVWNTSFEISRFNHAFERLTGLLAEDVLGKPLDILFPAGSKDESLTRIKSASSGERWEAEEIPILKSDGSERTVLWNSANVRNTDGTAVVATIAQGQDITERKQAEEALRESEERYRLIFETANEGIWVTDGERRTILVNQRMADMLGYTIDELQGRIPSEFLHVGQEPVVLRARQELAGGATTNYEFRFQRKDGADLWVISSAAPVKDSEGRFIRTISMLSDITARKQAEERLRASLGEKEVLLKEIHHRVKNNMQVISSLISLQANSLADPAETSILKDLQARVRSMALVHEQLYLSHDISRVDFAEYARSLLSSIWRANSSDAARIQLKLDLEPVTLPVEAAVPCGLILNELATNALKHAFRGRDQGTVIVSLHSASSGRTCLAVRDDGIGLPADLDPDKSPTLGLQLVAMLVRQLGGAIEVCRGGGTEFKITFPSHKY